ncbi:MAG: hypothetical protein HYX26_07120 [Acidobacteriales bacterium]|nr:hypothetical protein [Terriglobales bacterium]
MEGYEVENFCRGTFNGIETECFDCKIIRGDSEFQELTAKRLTVIGFRIKDNKFPEFQLRHKHSTDSAATESLKAGDSIFILGDLVISGWNSKAIEETITPKLAERLVEIVKDLYFLEKAGDWTICYRKSVPLSQLEEFFTVSHQVAVLLQK